MAELHRRVDEVKTIVVNNNPAVKTVARRTKSLKSCLRKTTKKELDANSVEPTATSTGNLSQAFDRGDESGPIQHYGHYLRFMSSLGLASDEFETSDLEETTSLHESDCDESDLFRDDGKWIDHATSEAFSIEPIALSEPRADSNASILGLAPSTIYARNLQGSSNSHLTSELDTEDSEPQISSTVEAWANTLYQPEFVPASNRDARSKCPSESAIVRSPQESLDPDAPDVHSPSSQESTILPLVNDEISSPKPLVQVHWQRTPPKAVLHSQFHFQIPWEKDS